MRGIKTRLLILLLSCSMLASARDIVIKYVIINSRFHPPLESVGDFFHLTSDSIVNNDFFSGSISDLSQSFFIERQVLLQKDSNQIVVVVTYKTDGLIPCILWDGYGNQLLLPSASGDTITATVQPLHMRPNYQAVLNDSIVAPWTRQLTFDKAHSYVNFFEQLAQLHGDIRQPFQSLKTFGYDLPVYLNYIDKVYKDRVAFMRSFVINHRMPQELQFYAFKEIEYGYYKSILEPLSSKPSLIAQYPRNVQDSLKNIENDWTNEQLYRNSALFKSVTKLYIERFLYAQPTSSYWNANHLSKCYTFGQKNLSGGIKDYFLSALMKEYVISDKSRSADKYYETFNRDVRNGPMIYYVDSVYRLIHDPKSALRDVLAFEFQNSQQQYSVLKTFADKQLILLDCWATWCVPCRKQAPYLDSLAAIYKDKVQFVSISLDQSSSKWMAQLNGQKKEHPDLTPLYAVGGFQSKFARAFFISSIPRYILISSKGDILNDNMPFPQDTDHFRSELNRYLK